MITAVSNCTVSKNDFDVSNWPKHNQEIHNKPVSIQTESAVSINRWEQSHNIIHVFFFNPSHQKWIIIIRNRWFEIQCRSTMHGDRGNPIKAFNIDPCSTTRFTRLLALSNEQRSAITRRFQTSYSSIGKWLGGDLATWLFFRFLVFNLPSICSSFAFFSDKFDSIRLVSASKLWIC